MNTMKHFGKRGVALFLAMVMCLSLLPMTAFAADADGEAIDGIVDGVTESEPAEPEVVPEVVVPEAVSEVVKPEAVPEAAAPVYAPSYAGVDEFYAALAAMGDADDEASVLAVLANIEAVYYSLSPEDQAAVANEWANAKAYMDQVRAGNANEGINTTVGDTTSVDITVSTTSQNWKFCNSSGGNPVTKYRYYFYDLPKGTTISMAVDFVWSSSVGAWQLRTTAAGNSKLENIYVFTADMSSVRKPWSQSTGSAGSNNSLTKSFTFFNSDGTAVSSVGKLQAAIQYVIQDTDTVVATDTYKPAKYGTATVNPDSTKVPEGYALVDTKGVSVTTGKDSSTPDPITFYVKLSGTAYTITYDANNGSGEPAATQTEKNTSATKSGTLATGIPSRNGYQFLGWSTSSSATTASHEAGGTYNFTGNTTLYAVWKCNHDHDDAGNCTTKDCDHPHGENDCCPRVTDDGKGISVEKTRTSAATASVGDTITWSIEVTNNSNVAKTVTLTELEGVTLSPSATVKVAPKDQPGDSVTVAASYQVQEKDAGTTLTNTVIASVPGSTNPKDTDEDSDEGTTINPIVTDDGKGIEVTKKLISAATLNVGDNAQWEITVTNLSNVEKTVTLTEGLEGVTLSPGSTVKVAPAGQPGNSATVIATLKLTDDHVSKELYNTVTAKTNPDDDGTPATSDKPIEVKALAANIVVTKTASIDTAKPGDAVTYTITVTNTGNKTAENVAVLDELDSNLTFVKYGGDVVNVVNEVYGIGDLAAGQTKTVKITAEVNSGVTAGTPITNTAIAVWDGHSTPGTPNPDGTQPKGEVEITVGEKLYTVKFCANGGAWEGDTEASTDLHRTARVKFGNPVTKVDDDPVLAGFTFVGWYLEDSDDPYEFSTPITEDTELFARWTPDVVYSDELTVSKQHTFANGAAKLGDLVMYQVTMTNGTTGDWDRLYIIDPMPVGLELYGNIAVMIVNKDGTRNEACEADLQFNRTPATATQGEILRWVLPNQNLPQGATVILGYCTKVTKVGGDLVNTAEGSKFGTSKAAPVVAGISLFSLGRLARSPIAFDWGSIVKDPDAPSSSDTATLPTEGGGDDNTGGGDNKDDNKDDNKGDDNKGDDNKDPDDNTPNTPVNPPSRPDPRPTTPDPIVFPDPTPGTTIIEDEEVPLASAMGLNDTEHMAYIIGYEDGTVQPEGNITRAEVATIFFRLMTDTYRAINWSTENDFSDVSVGMWYNNAISTCANAEILKGYTDGTFLPGNNITRAEFAAIAARFLDGEYTGEGVELPSDCEGHWAADYIRSVMQASWWFDVGEKFEPSKPITRAEVMVVINRMLHRVPEKEHMLPEMKKWSDNPEDAWYYEAVQEATNEHDYEWIDKDETIENWTELLSVRDWAALEKEWADAYAG